VAGRISIVVVSDLAEIRTISDNALELKIRGQFLSVAGWHHHLASTAINRKRRSK
jgi:hypothetical protein